MWRICLCVSVWVGDLVSGGLCVTLVGMEDLFDGEGVASGLFCVVWIWFIRLVMLVCVLCTWFIMLLLDLDVCLVIGGLLRDTLCCDCFCFLFSIQVQGQGRLRRVYFV